MIYVLLAFVILALMYEKHTKSEEVEGSKNFHVSDGASKTMYLQMHKDGLGRDALKMFVQLEDRLLGIERTSVCTGMPYIVQASLISNKIKETFPKYDFSYHTIHLKQIAEPNKLVNIKIKC
jgi:hypothetical protein